MKLIKEDRDNKEKKVKNLKTRNDDLQKKLKDLEQKIDELTHKIEEQSFNTALVQTNEISILSPFVGSLALKPKTSTAVNGASDFNKNQNKYKQQYNSIDVDGNCDGRIAIGIKNLNH